MEQDIQLIETLLLEPGGELRSLDDHLRRMESSAARLGFAFSRFELLESIQLTLRNLDRPADSKPQRLRILLRRDGKTTLGITSVDAMPKHPKVVLSPKRMNSLDPLLQHKTTRREIYDSELALWNGKTGCFDVIFLNERDELTEGSRTNLFLRIENQWRTPPLSSGVLPGVTRARLIREWDATESPLQIADLERAERIVVCNSVRGPVEVEWHR